MIPCVCVCVGALSPNELSALHTQHSTLDTLPTPRELPTLHPLRLLTDLFILYSIRLVYNYNINMDRALMTARLLEFETQAFSLSHSLFRCSSDLDPQVVLLLQKAAPACYHIRAPLARALEGGQETIFNEICDLITQTQTRIQYKMPFGGSLPVIPPPSTATMHSRLRVLVVGVLFGCAVVYHYRARIRRVTGRITRWGL